MRGKQCFLEKASVQRVRNPPRQDRAAMPVHDRDEVRKTAPHRDVRDVRAPDLIRVLDLKLPQKVWIDLVLGTLDRSAWLRIRRDEAHRAYQPARACATDREAARL